MYLFILFAGLLVGCGSVSSDGETQASAEAGSEAATTRELPSGDAMLGVRFEASIDASDGGFSTDDGGGRIDSLGDAVAHDDSRSHADSGAPQVESGANGDGGDAEAGPPPLTCTTKIGRCSGPWPFECYRSTSAECCNYQACGGDQ
jgi:hypothetical protein